MLLASLHFKEISEYHKFIKFELISTGILSDMTRIFKGKFMTAIFLLPFCLLVSKAFAQNETNLSSPAIIPPSPNAASLGKYGEIPVSLYTGVPNISITLWNIKVDNFTLPVSLSYHASGVRVEQNASWVGLGWSLNAGGVITRSVRGRPDGLSATLTPIPAPLIDPSSLHTTCEYWEACRFIYRARNREATIDTEPDVFFFNFGGISGKFVFDRDGKPHTIPYQNIKIEGGPVTGSALTNSPFEITIADGTKFSFHAVEFTDSKSISYPYYEWESSSYHDNSGDPDFFNSSWYLTEIKTTNGKKITFEYVDEDSKIRSGVSQELRYNLGVADGANQDMRPNSFGTLSQISGKRLSKITHPGGSIDFVANKVREDLAYQNTAPKALEKIVIKDAKQHSNKVFMLTTDYFYSTDAVQDNETKRLKLLSLTELSDDESLKKPSYKFTYEGTTLPNKFSTSQDHWGYYNGKQNNDKYNHPTLIPFVRANSSGSVRIRFITDTNNGFDCQDCPLFKCSDFENIRCREIQGAYNSFVFKGADRNPDFNFMKAGVLTSIQYPTGGETKFDYEPHDYLLDNFVTKTGSFGFDALASFGDNSNPPTITTAEKIFKLSDYIPANSMDMNSTLNFRLSMNFNLDGNNNKCFKCGQPTTYLEDITTGERLIESKGFSGFTLGPTMNEGVDRGLVTIDRQLNSPDIYITGTNFLYLNHTYRIYASTPLCDDSDREQFEDCPENLKLPRMEAFISCSVSYKTSEIEKYNGVIGGLRIRNISTFNKTADNSPIIKKYSYSLPNEPLKSSGQIIDWPNYVDKQTYEATANNDLSPAIYTYIGGGENSFVLTSGSKYELGQTNGSYVGYSNVKESLCKGEDCLESIGWTDYTYSNSSDFSDFNSQVFGFSFFGNLGDTCPPESANRLVHWDLRWITKSEVAKSLNYFPYPPKNSMDWKRGLLQKMAVYSTSGALLKQIKYFHNDVNMGINRKVITALKLSSLPCSYTSVYGVRPLVDCSKNNTYFGRYDYICAWNYLNKEETTEIDANGNSTVSTIEYVYDNPLHAQVTRTINSTSEINKKLITEYKYPADFSSLDADAAINDMKSITRFMHSPIIQKSVIEEKGSDQKVISSQITRYAYFTGENNTSNILPKEVAALETKEPLNINEFPPYKPKDGYDGNKFKKRLTYDQYDLEGNLLQFHKDNDVNIVYIYGYNGVYPIAEIKNADLATVNSALNQIGLSQIYIYSLSDGISIREKMELLRTNLLMKDASISYYTYLSNVGMASSTDSNGITTYYQYDEFGRLEYIKDQNQRIVKNYVYHYKD